MNHDNALYGSGSVKSRNRFPVLEIKVLADGKPASWLPTYQPTYLPT